jgi:hypothetical protein
MVMRVSKPVFADASRFCDTVAMHGGFDAVHLGSKPMKPGFPFGSVPARAWLPDAVVKSYPAPRQKPTPFAVVSLSV